MELGSQLKFFTKDVELRRLLLEFPVQNIYSRMEKRFVAKSMNKHTGNFALSKQENTLLYVLLPSQFILNTE